MFSRFTAIFWYAVIGSALFAITAVSLLFLAFNNVRN